MHLTNYSYDKYQIPAPFDTGAPIHERLLEQENISPTCYSRYCIVLTEVIKILKFEYFNTLNYIEILIFETFQSGRCST
jgi:hypothetical protein